MYIGESRSIRSADAIDHFEVPLSWFTKDVLMRFKKSGFNNQDSTTDSKPFPDQIFKVPLYVWKFVAKTIGPSSWHHTGKFYRKTYQYSLVEVAEYLTDHYRNEINESNYLRRHCFNNRHNRQPSKLGVLKVTDWGGTRNHPKLLGHHLAYGFVRGKFLVAFDDSQFHYLLGANRVDEAKYFTNLRDFKRYLGKAVDLRMFKAFLRHNNVKL